MHQVIQFMIIFIREKYFNLYYLHLCKSNHIYIFNNYINFSIKKSKKIIIPNSLKLITISEILNCIPKIINIFKNDEELYGRKMGYIYIIFVIFNL